MSEISQEAGGPIEKAQNESLIERVRRGMTLNSDSIDWQARQVGVSRAMFSLVRKCLILLDRQVLHPGEEQTVREALHTLENDHYGNLRAATEMTAPILNAYWEEKTKTGERRRNIHKVKKLQKRFDNTLFAIKEACSNNEEMVIPVLTFTEREEAGRVLIECLQSLWQLFYKIRGERQ